jgi:hypothetical protein
VAERIILKWSKY